MIGLESASSSKPMPLSWARAAARGGAVERAARELWRGSSAAMAAAKPSRAGGAPARLRVGARRRLCRALAASAALGARRAARAPTGRAARGRAGPARVDLAAGQVQVGLGDQAALVALAAPSTWRARRRSRAGAAEPYGRVSSGNSTQYSFSSWPVCGR